MEQNDDDYNGDDNDDNDDEPQKGGAVYVDKRCQVQSQSFD